MGRLSERTALATAVVLSVLLTALTTWAVWQQSRALQERDLADLRRAAEQTASRMDDGLRRDLLQVFDTAGLAYTAGGATWVNYWAAGQKRWPIILLRTNADWQRLPKPGTPPLPSVGGSSAEAPPPQFEAQREELRRGAAEFALSYQRLASPASAPAAGAELRYTFAPDFRAMVVAGTLAGKADLALASPVAEHLWRYGARDENAPFELVVPGESPTRTPLAACGPAFGDATLQATPATETRLQNEARRRRQFVLLTAGGSAGGWGLLLWLMYRLIAGHREVVRIQKRIVADVSHELKTPLALIRLHAETLKEGRVRDTNRQQEYLETITRESERLTILLDSILDFSKFERGQREYDFHDCDVSAVARQAWTLYEPQLQAGGFDARCELPAGRVLVLADAHALQQVLVNLLQNACRYSRERKFVRLRVRTEGHIVVMEVEDRGVGMSREQMRELGASFVRGPDPLVRQTRGTGLGLAIVHHIVSAHRGKMEVQSTPGEGSTFTVWLPLHTAGKAAAQLSI